ncbi:MAG: hypothetical protein IPK64_12330 [bacterium]|nr:hypothetical protein [bacterium]
MGIAVFGTALVWLGPEGQGTLDVAFASLVTAAAVAGGGLALARAWRRARRPIGGRQLAGGGGRLELVPLGDGQAAIVYDASADSGSAPSPAVGPNGSEAAAAATAIWDAVDAAVRAVAAEPDRHDPEGPARMPSPRNWAKRLSRRLAHGRQPEDFP